MIISLGCLSFCLAASVAAETGRKVDVSTTFFESGVSDVQWLTDTSRNVLVLTQLGHLWTSNQYGRRFTDITHELLSGDDEEKLEPNYDRIIERIIVHPVEKMYAAVLTRVGQFFLTEDGGISWKKISHKKVGLKKNRLNNFIFHPTNPQFALFSIWSGDCTRAGTAQRSEECNHQLFVTKDFAKSFQFIANYVVQYSWGAPRPGSPENSSEWPNWSPAISDSIYYTYHDIPAGTPQPRYGGWHKDVHFAIIPASTVVRSHSQNLAGARGGRVLVKGGNKFLISRNYIFVAKLSNYAKQGVILLVSSDFGKNFKQAKIPTELIEKSYTILDTNDQSVLIHVNHGGGNGQATTINQAPTDNTGGYGGSPVAAFGMSSLEGNVYISDQSGLRYSLSLPNNIRATSGECEFDRVLGVDGVYMANFRDYPIVNNTVEEEDQPDEQNAYQDELEKRHSARRVVRSNRGLVRTVISHDKGGYWRYLKPPKIDSLGKIIQCEDAEGCYLHLHGITQFDRFAPFYSVENAVGIIMGTGNVGSSLIHDPAQTNTYISRDAGLTWHEAHKGAFIYEFGDHGGLIVMAHDTAETNQVVFSWNEGHSWYDFDLGVKKVRVDNVVIEPTSSGVEFLLYGTVPAGTSSSLDDKVGSVNIEDVAEEIPVGLRRSAASSYRGERGVIFHLDFSTLGQPQCQGIETAGSLSSDYELWSPGDGQLRRPDGGVVKPGSANGGFTGASSGFGNGDPNGCLLGRKMTFARKRVTSECYNGKNFVRKKEKTICECTKQDYECEIGFYRAVGGGQSAEGCFGEECIPNCVPSPYRDRQYMDVEGCTSSGIYYTYAYRKVPGDECQGGWRQEKVAVPCPPGSPLRDDAKATLFAIFIIGSLLSFVSWGSRHPRLKRYLQHKGFDNFIQVGYHVVGKAQQTVSKGSEELFNFWSLSANNGQHNAHTLGPLQTDPSGGSMIGVVSLPHQADGVALGPFYPNTTPPSSDGVPTPLQRPPTQSPPDFINW